MTLILVIVLFVLLAPGAIRALARFLLIGGLAVTVVFCYLTLTPGAFNQLVIGLIILVVAGHGLHYLVFGRHRSRRR